METIEEATDGGWQPAKECRLADIKGELQRVTIPFVLIGTDKQFVVHEAGKTKEEEKEEGYRVFSWPLGEVSSRGV